MTILFLDSSALVKRYMKERGSTWIHAQVDLGVDNKLVVARTAWVEVCSAFARLVREGALGHADLQTTLETLRYDWNSQYQVVELDEFLTQSAVALLFKHPLRAFDAIQLAACLRLKSVTEQLPLGALIFVSADDRLLAAALAEGLPVQNPNEFE